MRSVMLGAAAVLTLIACTESPTTLSMRDPIDANTPSVGSSGNAMRQFPADPSFRLDAPTRAQLADGYDPEALERLLQHVKPEYHGYILKFFVRPSEGATTVRVLEGLPDPVLQGILEEVWAPRWDLYPEEVFSAPDMQNKPGRALALSRRANINKPDASKP